MMATGNTPKRRSLLAEYRIDKGSDEVEESDAPLAEYGKWEASALRVLIAKMAQGRDLRGSTRQSRLAMEVATKTGCSYSWAWREVERIAGGPRSDGGVIEGKG
jgi:hypothetical protein